MDWILLKDFTWDKSYTNNENGYVQDVIIVKKDKKGISGYVIRQEALYVSYYNSIEDYPEWKRTEYIDNGQQMVYTFPDNSIAIFELTRTYFKNVEAIMFESDMITELIKKTVNDD